MEKNPVESVYAISPDFTAEILTLFKGTVLKAVTTPVTVLMFWIPPAASPAATISPEINTEIFLIIIPS
jgi:hypothetical protein